MFIVYYVLGFIGGFFLGNGLRYRQIRKLFEEASRFYEEAHKLYESACRFHDHAEEYNAKLTKLFDTKSRVN